MTGRRIGYARVSSTDQDLSVQLAELGPICDRVFREKMTGTRANRPELLRMLRHVEPGDAVVIYKLDRLGRTLRDVLNLAHGLQERGVELRSLHEGIDTSTAMGRAFFHFVAVLAELERDLIVERTSAGRAIARAKGRPLGGRAPKLGPEQVEQARELLGTGKHTVASVARSMGVHRVTLWRYLEAT